MLSTKEFVKDNKEGIIRNKKCKVFELPFVSRKHDHFALDDWRNALFGLRPKKNDPVVAGAIYEPDH